MFPNMQSGAGKGAAPQAASTPAPRLRGGTGSGVPTTFGGLLAQAQERAAARKAG